MNVEKKYALVCYLEGDSRDKTRNIQEKLSEITGSRKCLDGWQPHITLGSGVLVSQDKQQTFENSIESLAKTITSFTIKLKGFGGTSEWKAADAAKAQKFVLWVQPVMTDELQFLFNTIAEKITDHYETYYPRITEYSPHITIAYGDLTKEGYGKGMKYLETLNHEDTITISHIALVENFPDKGVEYKRFYFIR